MIEAKINRHSHNTVDSLKAAIVEQFAAVEKGMVNKSATHSAAVFRHSSPLVSFTSENKQSVTQASAQ